MDEDESAVSPLHETLEPPSEESECLKIRCTDYGSLSDTMKVIDTQISELADSSIEDRKDFMALFNNSFKSALLENILVNDLPLVINSSKLTSSENEGEKQIIDNNAIYAKLSGAICKTAKNRKAKPPQYCRIMKQKMKHEYQNLKRAKVINASEPKDFSEAFKKRNKIKIFTEFCNEFKLIQEKAQAKALRRKELELKINLAGDIQRSQKEPSVMK